MLEQNYSKQLLPHLALYLVHNVLQFYYFSYILPRFEHSTERTIVGILLCIFILRQFYNELI